LLSLKVEFEKLIKKIYTGEMGVIFSKMIKFKKIDKANLIMYSTNHIDHNSSTMIDLIKQKKPFKSIKRLERFWS